MGSPIQHLSSSDSDPLTETGNSIPGGRIDGFYNVGSHKIKDINLFEESRGWNRREVWDLLKEDDIFISLCSRHWFNFMIININICISVLIS